MLGVGSLLVCFALQALACLLRCFGLLIGLVCFKLLAYLWVLFTACACHLFFGCFMVLFALVLGNQYKEQIGQKNQQQ